jgi:hypothetical protein
LKSFSKFKVPALVLIAMMAVGCSSPEEKKKHEEDRIAAEAKAEEQKKNPIVTVIGTYDGCEVKHYDRGYYTESFFISKCAIGTASETSTMTSMQRVGGGKHTRYVPKVDITQEVAKFDAEVAEKKAKIIAELKKMQKVEEEEIQKRKDLAIKAKAKLTKEELDALGLNK